MDTYEILDVGRRAVTHRPEVVLRFDVERSLFRLVLENPTQRAAYNVSFRCRRSWDGGSTSISPQRSFTAARSSGQERVCTSSWGVPSRGCPTSAPIRVNSRSGLHGVRRTTEGEPSSCSWT